MRKLRLGVIGARSWTVSSHLPNLARHRDEVEFVIVNRRNPDLLERIRSNFRFERATTDWRDVIAEKPDIVVVGSPPGYHWEESKAALEAGAHVMCEKPFTIDPAHAWDLDATARRTGKALILAYVISGATGRFGTQHSATGESWYMHLPGLRVGAASSPGSAYELRPRARHRGRPSPSTGTR